MSKKFKFVLSENMLYTLREIRKTGRGAPRTWFNQNTIRALHSRNLITFTRRKTIVVLSKRGRHAAQL